MKIAQKDRIINYIREFGSISSWEAYSDLGITQLVGQVPKIELFARQYTEGWDCWGNEV